MKRGFLTRIQHAARQAVHGTVYVMKQPLWAIVALITSFVISFIIYFSINVGFYGSLIGPGLSLIDNLVVIGLVITSMVSSYGDDLNGILLLLVSLFQGVAIAVLIYTARQNKKVDKGVAGQSGLALVAATVGLGCVPCGTSLLIPVMTVLFSSAAPSLIGTANVIVLVVALLLTVFALYRVSKVADQHRLMGQA